jgi:hypothetical protein
MNNKRKMKKKRAGEMAQSVDPKFKHQCHTHKKSV